MIERIAIGALVVACLVAGQAHASSSAWELCEGASVRLVTKGAPDEAGVITGALQIDLRPGWKTYWVDPGDAGAPPSLDVSGSSNLTSASISYPPPKRFNDGFARWAGYDADVSFPVTFTLADARRPARIDAKVFLGVCQTICVPFQASLEVDPGHDPDNAEDKAIVTAAMQALPGPASEDFGAEAVPGGKDAMRVRIAHDGDGASIDLFLAGSNGYQFGPPERQEQRGELYFSIPILDRPDKMPDEGGLNYTMTGASGSVSGTLPFPPAP